MGNLVVVIPCSGATNGLLREFAPEADMHDWTAAPEISAKLGNHRLAELR